MKKIHRTPVKNEEVGLALAVVARVGRAPRLGGETAGVVREQQ